MALPTPQKIPRRYSVIIPIKDNFNIDLDIQEIKYKLNQKKVKNIKSRLSANMDSYSLLIGTRLPFNAAFSLAFAYHRVGFNRVYLLEKTGRGIPQTHFVVAPVKMWIPPRTELVKFRIFDWPDGASCPTISSLINLVFSSSFVKDSYTYRTQITNPNSEIEKILTELSVSATNTFTLSSRECMLLTSLGIGDFLFYNDVISKPKRRIYIKIEPSNDHR